MMSLVHILALCFVALCFAQNEFCYSGADAVYPHYVTFPFPVYEKSISLGRCYIYIYIHM